MVKCVAVDEGSPAARAGIEPGDVLVSVNAHEINDVLDYDFYTAERRLELITERGGELNRLTLRKGEYEPLGLEFETYLIDRQHHCRNNCIFCFVDQLPKGMRESLYFKDDDERLSFLFGNYITLTNMKEKDIRRLIEMHISPVNVSVHTTNPELRVRMMGNRFAGETLRYLDMMAEGGLKLNTQLVLCPGINDGKELERTFSDLAKLGPAVESAVCVPVGLTKYREKLPKLTPYDAKGAKEVISIVDSFREKMKKERGIAVAYAADEFFIKAGLPLPEYEYYDEFTQLEDGVGLCTLLKHEFYEALDYFPPAEYRRRVTIPTGKAAYSTIKELANAAESRYNGLKIDVIAMENNFFGELITVTGLLTGRDIAAQLKNRDNGDAVLICESTLRYEHDKFIDDTTPEYVEHELGLPVLMVPNDGYKLLCAMLGEDAEDDCEVIYG